MLLTLTTFIWGTTFVVTKQALAGVSPAALIFGRFVVAAVVFVPLLRFNRKLWQAAAELGVLLWLGFATQTIGLATTTVGRSAFITSLHVIVVPMLGTIGRRKTTASIWIAAVTAVVGVGLLCHDGSPPNRGDLWTLLCAISWAVYIVRLERWMTILPAGPLTAAQLVVVTSLSAGWLIESHPAVGPIPWIAIGYLGVAATAATTWFQAVGQKSVPAPQAAVLYTLEPVWAALFGGLVLHELLGPRGIIGVTFIVLAAVTSQRPWRHLKGRRARLPTGVVQ